MPPPSDVTVEGISIDLRLVQNAKAISPIVLNDEGAENVMPVRFVQLENAALPILVTEEGILIFVRPD